VRSISLGWISLKCLEEVDLGARNSLLDFVGVVEEVDPGILFSLRLTANLF